MFLNRNRINFAPADPPASLLPEGGDPPPGGPPPNGGDPPPAAPEGGPKAFFAEGFDAAAIPEKFRTEAGELDVGRALSSYTELEKKLGEGAGEPAPDKYELNLPKIEGVGEEILKELIPEGHEDPFLGAMMEVAKEMDLPQAKFDKFLGRFLEYVVNQETETHAQAVEALGGQEKFNATVSQMSTFYKSHLSADAYAHLRSIATNSATLNLMNEIRGLVVNEARIPTNDPPGVDGGLTEESLRAKMRTDAYWNPQHPDYKAMRDEVAAGFEKLYNPKA